MENKEIIKELVKLQIDVAKEGERLGIKNFGDLDYMLLLAKTKVITKKRTYLDVAENFKTFIYKHFINNKNFTERIDTLANKINNSELGNLIAFSKPTGMSSLELDLYNYRIATQLNLSK